MQEGSLVVCIQGHPGVLTEGEIYTVTSLMPFMGVTVEEAKPPYPYPSFKMERFKEVQPPMDVQSLVNETICTEI
jgi:hypothetical protein